MSWNAEVNGDDYDINDGVDNPKPGVISDELLLHPHVVRILVILSLDQAILYHTLVQLIIVVLEQRFTLAEKLLFEYRVEKARLEGELENIGEADYDEQDCIGHLIVFQV